MRHTFQNITALVALAALLLPTTLATAQTTTTPPPLEQHEPSVFLVRSVMQSSGGTGFVVLRGREPILVTNHHVCAVPTLSYKLRIDNDHGSYLGTIVAVSYDSDLCFVRLPGNFDLAKHPPLPIASRDVDIGETVSTVGYPKLVGPFHGAGILLAKQVIFDTIVGKYVMNSRTTFLAQLGQSGSPIFNDSGEVVGILVAINPHYGHTFYIPVKDLHTFMGGEAWTVAQP